MGRQSTFKRIRSAVDKRKHKIIIDYMRDHWDVVLNSSISMMKGLKLGDRLSIAFTIIAGRRKRLLGFGKTKEIKVNKPAAPVQEEKKPDAKNSE